MLECASRWALGSSKTGRAPQAGSYVGKVLLRACAAFIMIIHLCCCRCSCCYVEDVPVIWPLGARWTAVRRCSCDRLRRGCASLHLAAFHDAESAWEPPPAERAADAVAQTARTESQLFCHSLAAMLVPTCMCAFLITYVERTLPPCVFDYRMAYEASLYSLLPTCNLDITQKLRAA